MISFYVAAKWDDRKTAEEVSRQLVQQGYKVTCDWWNSKSPSVEESLRDIHGVESCDVFLGIFDKEFIYRGAIFEMGIAYALGKRIIIIGNQLDSMIFMNLPSILRFDNLNEVLAHYELTKIKQDDPV